MNAAWWEQEQKQYEDLAMLARKVAQTQLVAIGRVADGVEFAVIPDLSPSERVFVAQLCQRTLEVGDILDISDLRKDPEFLPPAVPEGARPLAFFHGVAIPAGENEPPWFLAVMDRDGRRLKAQQRSGLQTIGHQILLRHEGRRRSSHLERTERQLREVETARRDQEHFFQTLVESLPQSIFRKDLDGKITFANKKFCETLGLPWEEIRGKTDFDLNPPELARKYREDDLRVIEGGKPVEVVEPNESTTGEKRWVHVIKVPLYDSAGKLAGIQGIFWDVTREKKAEEELERERDLLRVLLESAPDAIYFKDSQSRITRASAALALKLGYSNAVELVGKTDWDLFHPSHAAQAERDEREMLVTGVPKLGYTEEESLKDGTRRYALTSKLPLRDAKGQIIGTFGISKDITELRATQERVEEAEANFRGIVEGALDGIFQTTPDGHYISANPALAKIYGFSSPRELIAQRTDIASQLYLDPTRREEFERLMTARGEVDQFESQVYRKDGTIIWISENARAVKRPDGTLIRYEGTVEDITARKRSEAELNRANDELARARDAALESARIKATFLANTSHELRTPMNAILGFTELLLGTPLNDEQRDHLQGVHSSAKGLLKLLNDILDLSKLESGKVVFERASFSPRQVVEETAELMADLAFPKGLELTVWMDHALPARVWGDEGRLRQVLNNLLGNALKFTDRGDVSVRVEVIRKTEQDAELKVSISDTGVGIREEMQAKIFEAFIQEDASTTRRFGGTGLGLNITRQLVESMGGRIEVRSRPGEGSTFSFTVRLDLDATTRADPLPDFSGEARAVVASANARLRESLQHQLRALGVRAIGTQLAAEAWEVLGAAESEGIQFIFVDRTLPDSDGRAFVRLLADDPARSRVNAVLLEPFGRTSTDGSEVEGCQRLVKPVRLGRLAECLNEILHPMPVAAMVAGSSTHPSPGPAAIGELAVLLVDDNPVNQKVASAQLRRLGFVAETARNGREALEKLSTRTFDLVLMDCQMPVMDGFDTTREVRRMERSGLFGSRHPHRIVALTANAMSGDREQCLGAGMDDFLSKPLELEALRGVLRRTAELLDRKMTGSSMPVGSDSTPGTGGGSGHPSPADSQLSPSPWSAEPILNDSFLREMKAMNLPEAPDEAAELVALYLSDQPVREKLLVEAMTRGDLSAAASAAHAIKGSSGNLGGRRVAAAAALLETALKRQEPHEARRILHELRAEMKALADALSAWK